MRTLLSVAIFISLLSTAFADCPSRDEIEPCNCQEWNGLTFTCYFATVSDIQRVFSVEFPSKNLKRIEWSNYWNESISIQQNIFSDKTVQEIEITAKLIEIHPKAFENTADTIKQFQIGFGPKNEDIHPIKNIPWEMFASFPNLESLNFQGTMINDDTFNSDFSKLEFQSLGMYLS